MKKESQYLSVTRIKKKDLRGIPKLWRNFSIRPYKPDKFYQKNRDTCSIQKLLILSCLEPCLIIIYDLYL